MALEGYESQATQVGKAVRTETPALQVATQTQQSLSDKLSQFSNFMFDKHKEVMVDKAKDDAINDSIKGKPYHEKSVYTAYGKAYNNTLSATYAADADIQLSKMSQELALKHENDSVAYSESMQSYIDEMTKNAPTPELKSVIDITGTKLKNGTFGKLQIAENERFKDSALSTFKNSFDQSISRVINLQSSGKDEDKADADIIVQSNLEHMGTLISDGILDPAIAQSMIYESQYQVNYGISVNKMADLLGQEDLAEATKYLREQTESHRTDMNVKQNKEHQKKLSRMFSSEIKRRDGLEETKVEFATQQLNDMTELVKSGKKINLPKAREAYKSAGASARYNYDKASAVSDIKAAYDTKSIAEQMVLLESIDTEDFGVIEKFLPGHIDPSVVKQEVRDWLEADIKERQKNYASDGVKTAQKEGYIAPVHMGQKEGIENFIASIPDAVKNSNTVKQITGLRTSNLLTKEDAKSWANYLDNADANEQIGFVHAISQAAPHQAKKLFKEIGAKHSKSFDFVSRMVINDNEEMAKLAISGAKAKDVSVEDETEKKRNIVNAIGTVFPFADATDTRNSLVSGALNVNRGLVSEGKDPMTGTEAVEATLGKIEMYNNQGVVMPKETSKGDFENWLDNIKVMGNADLTELLRGVTDEDDKNVQLRYAGDGEYYIYILNDGKPYYQETREGNPMILKYGKDANINGNF